jgi:hypothetical protein
MFSLKFEHTLLKGGHFVIGWIFRSSRRRKDISDSRSLSKHTKDTVSDGSSLFLERVDKLRSIGKCMPDAVIQLAGNLFKLFDCSNTGPQCYIRYAFGAWRTESTGLNIPTIRLVVIIA